MTVNELRGMHNVSPYKNIAHIGKNCIIHPYTVIGYEGFGIIRDTNTGIPSQLPHTGKVWIGDNVRIGSNCTIEQGTKEDDITYIGNNVMIDANVVVGHNAFIGDGTIIVAGTVVGGTVKIGKNCFIGENVSLRQRITIGDQVVVGAGSYVSKDVPDRDIVGGVPAKSIKDKVHISDYDRFRMVAY